jgi:tRNA nucleotidyltransferase (CCA-adding enzyme)
LDFKIEPDTEILLKRDLAMIDTISGDRLRHELELIFNEELSSKILRRADDLGILRQLHTSLKGNGWLSAKLNEAQKRETNNDPTVFFALLTYNLNEEECRDTLKRLNISGKNGQIIKEVQKAKKELGALSAPNLPSSHVYRMLENFCNEAVNAIILAEEPSTARQRLELYIEELQKIRSILDGDDLMKMGITTGRKIGSILKQLLNAKIDQKVRTKSDEQKLVRLLIRGDKP